MRNYKIVINVLHNLCTYLVWIPLKLIFFHFLFNITMVLLCYISLNFSTKIIGQPHQILAPKFKNVYQSRNIII